MIVNGEKYKLPYFFRIKELTPNDIFRTYKRSTDGSLFVSVVKEYFRIVIKTMLNGYSWEFPKGLGELAIVKKDVTKEYLASHKNIITPKLGFYYSYSFKSEILDKNGMKLILEPNILNQANELVRTNQKDYRYER